MDDSWARRKFLDQLRGMVSGSIGLVEGCRALVRLLPSLPPEVAASEPALTVVGVESETDTFPLGQQRTLWAPDALRRADEELAEYIDVVREPLMAACFELERMVEGNNHGNTDSDDG
jgi:hypothetical protein